MKKVHTDGVKTLIEQIDKPLAIIAHRGPDGDAIGSSLGLYHVLLSLGKKVSVVMPTTYPEFLHWLPGNDEVVNYETNQEEAGLLMKEAGMVFCLDFNAPSRVEPMREILESSEAVKMMIDHHPQPEDFTTYLWSDVSASSTAQLVYEFVDSMGWLSHLNAAAATCLYTGILTDTGSFRFPSTSATTHRIVANLMEKGARNAEIYNALFDENRLGKLQLLGFCLSEKLVWLAEYATAYISLSLEELKRFDFKKGDTEGVVNYALSIKGAKLAVIFIEHEDIVKISFRSNGSFSVNDLARNHFFGGGHRNAAGGRFEGSLESAVKKFVDLLPEYKNELK